AFFLRRKVLCDILVTYMGGWLQMLTILIADDEKLERNGIKFLLKREKEEFQIIEAVNGKDALGVLASHHVDLLQSVIFCGQFIHAILFCSLLLRLLSFDFSLRIFLAQAGQYLDAPEPGTYSTPHTVQFLAGIAAHRFVGMICNSSTKPMNL